ncbi:MAG: alpha/beta hydrolase [Arenimonas sp.]
MIGTIFKRLILSAAFIYLSLCAWLYMQQRSMLYFPVPAISNVQAQPFELASDGLKLNGWVVNPGQSEAVIYFGGNGEQVEWNVPEFQASIPNKSVYLVPYRSYGGNPGEVTEENLYLDALNLFDNIKPQYQQVSLIGRSLGTGVATYVAAERNVNKLILVTPYDSIVNVAQDKYTIFPVSLLIKDRFESAERADKIKANTLIMIAGNDEVIPRANTENLIRHFKQKPNVVVFKALGHNSISDGSNYQKAIAEFLK